jgi:hypothetical protein
MKHPDVEKFERGREKKFFSREPGDWTSHFGFDGRATSIDDRMKDKHVAIAHRFVRLVDKNKFPLRNLDSSFFDKFPHGRLKGRLSVFQFPTVENPSAPIPIPNNEHPLVWTRNETCR